MKLIGLVFATVCLTGCAAMAQMNQEWEAENCVPAAAYNHGLTDGLTPGILPKADYASQCSSNDVALDTAYLKGYAKGMKSRPLEITINENKTKHIDHENPIGEDSGMPPMPVMPRF